MSEKEVKSDTQKLSDAGINPFAIQLFYESWSRHPITPRIPLTFLFRDAVISIEDAASYRKRLEEVEEPA